MNSQDPRAELRMLQDEIDELNRRKSALSADWDKESDGGAYAVFRAAETSKTLPALRELNERLAFLYGQRTAILKAHPGLQSEFGKPTKPEKRFHPTDRLATQAARTAEDRAKRKALISPGFKAWCAAQQPQVRASLENWENPGIRARFRAAQPPPPSPTENGTGAALPPQTSVGRGPMPEDFPDFLKEMEHPRARSSQSRQDDLWQSDAELRDVYFLWREERAQSKTPA